MLKNYFKIAIRQLLKNKVFSVINISGLAIGMASVILILLWVKHQVSFDNFHTKKDRIYSLWNKSDWGDQGIKCWEVTPKVAKATLQANFPEIEKVARVDWPTRRLITFGDKKIYSLGNVVDNEFLSIFDFPMLEGNIATMFSNPNSIVITPELAKKIFGNENPIGKVIKLENKDNLTITGIISTPPSNSRFEFEYLIPWKFIAKDGEETNWGDNSTRTYILLKENTKLAALEPKIKDIRKNYAKDSDVYDMFLYPLERWQLHSNFENGVESGGRIEIVVILGIIAGFILIIACINFMNLSTARSEKRAKEVGIRKTIGAFRSLLIRQFLMESVLLSFFSFILAIGLVILSLPAFNNLMQTKLNLNLLNPSFWLFSLTFVLLTGILAGSYPAFFLSSFQAVKVLKGTFQSTKSKFSPRKILVVLQFTIAIILIIGTILVRQQMSYVVERDSGYNKEQLMYHFLSNDLEKNYTLLKNDLLNQNLALSVTKCSQPITQAWSNSWGFEWNGKDPNDKTLFDRYYADEDIIKTAGFKLLQGRDFNLKEFPTDSTALILNESALKKTKFKNPIGQIIKDGDTEFHVIGVIKDFIINNPFEETRPMMLMGAAGWFNVIHVRLNKNTNQSEIKKIEALFKKYNPDFPIELVYTDEEYAQKFEQLQTSLTLATIFSSLTIFISCLGLFGLATYIAENRVKEIGVRKVLGASVSSIVTMLSINFIKLVTISIIIATPIAWWLMKKWLNNYTYRIEIEWWVFILAALIAISIALFTVMYQAIKAAISNPVKNLRTE